MLSTADRLALSDEQTFQDPAQVHAIFSAMRKEEPVAWCPEPWGGPGFWSVTKYDDIQHVSRLPKVFSSDARQGGITLPDETMIRNRRGGPQEFDKQFEEQTKVFENGRSMIVMDPPEHNQHRRMVAPGFTPLKLEAMIPHIRQRCIEIIDGTLGAKLDSGREYGECEFVAAVAAELPIQMLAELFGSPQSERHKLFEWSNIIIGGDDPDIASSQEQVMAAMMEMAGYAMQLHAQRKATPGDDLISMLVNTQVDGQEMSWADYLSAFILLVVAGNETTRNSISGGMQALSLHPAELKKLTDNPALIPQAIDEIIRWVSPVVYMRRTALEDAVVGGQQIRKGDKLALWYMSGNRDEDKWADPFTFNVTRNGPRHLSFGYGQHLCIGWRLAEIQLTVAIEEFLKRCPEFEVVGPINRMRTNFLNSIKRMTLKYKPVQIAA